MIEWAQIVFSALWKAAKTDADVFLLLVGGLALSALPQRLRGLGVGLLAYAVVHRTDMIATVIHDQLQQNTRLTRSVLAHLSNNE